MSYKKSHIVNEDGARLSLSHVFKDGRSVIFKLFEDRFDIIWSEKPSDYEAYAILPEYWKWWETVLQQVLELLTRRKVSNCRLELNQANTPVRLTYSFPDGLTVNAHSPSEGLYDIWAVKDGSNVRLSDRYLRSVVIFMEAYLYRSTSYAA